MSTSSKTLSTFLASDDGRPLTFEQLPFDHPLYILYSSGTTGPPKCIVHSAGVCERCSIRLVVISHTSRACSYRRKKSSWQISKLDWTIHTSNLQRYCLHPRLSPPNNT